MKAKEMAAEFQQSPTTETLASLIHRMIEETRDLSIKRSVKSNEGMTAILRESEQKWFAFCRLCPEVKEWMFKFILHKRIPLSKELLP